MEENEVTPEAEVPAEPVTEEVPIEEVVEQPAVEEPIIEEQQPEPYAEPTPIVEEPIDPTTAVLNCIASQGGRAHLDGIRIEGLSEEDVERVVRDLVMNGKLNKDASGMVWGGGY